eukprot:TRINITY_DN5559_c0_g2_i1.p1 TRINITY_DN5559_c0_g2~~TRINITY_DN5559_c0_g2_i1.p1  ORF type:complete len:256 (+),score=75.50 TRINITY_DN5559_c0_g2_i1:186-953(+)
MRVVDGEWEQLVSEGGTDGGVLANCFDEVVSTVPERDIYELRMGNELLFQGHCNLVQHQGGITLQLVEYGEIRKAVPARGEQLPPVLIRGKTHTAALFAVVLSRSRMQVDRLSFGIPKRHCLGHLQLIVNENNMRAAIEADALCRLATLIAKIPSALSRTPPHWVPDSTSRSCSACGTHFTFFSRRHHCRSCGELLCAHCTSQSRILAASPLCGRQRVCRPCAELRDCIASPLSTTSSTPDPAAISNASSASALD